MNLTDAEAAYIAGYIDGEGTIHVYHLNSTYKRLPRGHFTVSISADQVDPRPQLWLRDKVGGSLRVVNDKRGGRRPITRWQLGGTACEALLRRIVPFLIVKKEKALVALEMRDLINAQIRGRHLTKEQHCRRLRLVASAKAHSL